MCLAEHQEIVDAFFSGGAVKNFLGDPEMQKLIITMHLTDQKLYNNFDFVLKVQFNAERKTLPQHSILLKHLLAVVDFLALQFKLDRKLQQQVSDTRKRKYA